MSRQFASNIGRPGVRVHRGDSSKFSRVNRKGQVDTWRREWVV